MDNISRSINKIYNKIYNINSEENVNYVENILPKYNIITTLYKLSLFRRATLE